MRFRHPLNDILGRRSKIVLLRHMVLFRKECTGRELAGYTGLDHKTCHEALRDLRRHRVIDLRRIGTATAYSLRADHPIIREVLLPAFEWERNLIDRFARDVRKLLGPDALSIILFGSVARGTEEPESDVDLMIVTRDRPTARALNRKVGPIMVSLADTYGRVPQFIVRDVRTFRAAFRRQDPLFSEIVAAGRVLAGLPFREILKHGRKARGRETDSPR